MYSLNLHQSNLSYDTMTSTMFIHLANMVYKDIRERRAQEQLAAQQGKGLNQVKASLMKRAGRR